MPQHCVVFYFAHEAGGDGATWSTWLAEAPAPLRQSATVARQRLTATERTLLRLRCTVDCRRATTVPWA
jgi:hypothetical protein